MTHSIFTVFPFYLFVSQPKPDEPERKDAPARQKLLSSSERLRVPTPAERLLQR